MGRMLEALKHKELGRPSSRDRPFLDDSIEQVPAGDTASLGDDNVPFIEVGPNRKVDGSPQVMAVKHPAQPRVQPPHQPISGPVLSVPAPAVAVRPAETRQPRTLSVAFEPWPAVPLLDGIAPEIIVVHHPEHAISRQYANHAARLLEGEKTGKAQVFLLTGCRSQAGTSTVLLNLAASVAQQGKRVVVVDANSRRPSLAQRLGCTCTASLHDVLHGKAALEQAVLRTPIAGLYLLPAQQGDTRPLRPEAISWMLGWLGEHYNLVLIDGPALDSGAELAVLAAACDGVYLVVPDSESHSVQRSQAQSLSALGARLRGLFHTGIDSRTC